MIMDLTEYVLLLAAMFIAGILLEQLWIKTRQVHQWAKRRGCMATHTKSKGSRDVWDDYIP